MTSTTYQPPAATLNDVQPLTVAQYETCKDRAGAVLRQHAGRKPHRADYEADRAPLWSLWDVPAVVIMAAALLLSTAHVMTHMGKLAAETYPAASGIAGDVWDLATYGRVHQYAAIALAEAAVLLFVMLFKNVSLPRRGSGFRDYAGPVTLGATFLALAVMAALFVFNANLQSGTGLIESLLPPALTLGLGLYLEGKLAASLAQRDTVTMQYREALAVWTEAQRDITTHPDYRATLRKVLAEALGQLPHNQRLTMPYDVLALAVARELYREDIWQRSDRADMTAIARLTRDGAANFTPGATTAPSAPSPRPEAQPLPLALGSNGNGRH
jgi:hypothetical protein